MSDEAQTVEERLRAQADAGHPETWQPNAAGQELIGKVVRYSQATTARGDRVWIMVVESLRTPGRFASVWLLHTTLRNEIMEQKPHPGEIVFLRYEGLKQPKGGGEEYHGWSVVIDRDGSSSHGLPWQDAGAAAQPRTEAEAMTPHSTGPAAQSDHAEPWNDGADFPADDDIPF